MAERQNPFEIDPARLDWEWLRQPGLSRAAGQRQADAQHRLNQAKAALAIVAARLLLNVRDNPESFGLRVRPNESEVEAAVTLHADHQAAVATLHRAEFEFDVAKADTVAVTHDRRKALENYVQLLSLEYVCAREPGPMPTEMRRGAEINEKREMFARGVEFDDTNSE